MTRNLDDRPVGYEVCQATSVWGNVPRMKSNKWKLMKDVGDQGVFKSYGDVISFRKEFREKPNFHKISVKNRKDDSLIINYYKPSKESFKKIIGLEEGLFVNNLLGKHFHIRIRPVYQGEVDKVQARVKKFEIREKKAYDEKYPNAAEKSLLFSRY